LQHGFDTSRVGARLIPDCGETGDALAEG